jgi:hypothetical protein
MWIMASIVKDDAKVVKDCAAEKSGLDTDGKFNALLVVLKAFAVWNAML